MTVPMSSYVLVCRSRRRHCETTRDCTEQWEWHLGCNMLQSITPGDSCLYHSWLLWHAVNLWLQSPSLTWYQQNFIKVDTKHLTKHQIVFNMMSSDDDFDHHVNNNFWSWKLSHKFWGHRSMAVIRLCWGVIDYAMTTWELSGLGCIQLQFALLTQACCYWCFYVFNAVQSLSRFCCCINLNDNLSLHYLRPGRCKWRHWL